jgi:hypothetical protein
LPAPQEATDDEEAGRFIETVLEAMQQDSELARLSEAVEEAFRQATKRWAVPDAANCRMIALYLMALHQNPRRPKKTVGHNEQTSKVVASGTTFLRHLEAERREIEVWVGFAQDAAAAWRPAVGWLREQRKLLDLIQETSCSIASMLRILSPAKREPIGQIAAVATQAWEEASSGRAAPRSTNPNAPLCRFVVAALKLIGQQRSAAEVSEVLRGRRRK